MQKPLALSLGAFLRRARKNAGLTMRGLARAVGKDHKHISLIESDAVSPTVDTLRQICSAMNLEPWEAVAGFTKAELVQQLLGPVPFDDPDVREILRLASKPDGVEEIRAMLEVAKGGPAKFRETMAVLKEMRRIGLIGGGK